MNKKIGRIEFKIQCCKGIIWYLNVQFSIVILIQINKAVLIKGFIEIDMHTKAIYIFTMIVPWFRIYDDIFLPEVLRSFQLLSQVTVTGIGRIFLSLYISLKTKP